MSAPPQLFFPLVARLVYRDANSVIRDPECVCTPTNKCTLRITTENQWKVFTKKIESVLHASPKTRRGGIPYALIVSEQNPGVSVARLDKDRFGDQVWTSHFEF